MRTDRGQPLLIVGLGIIFVLVAMVLSSVFLLPTTLEVVTSSTVPNPLGGTKVTATSHANSPPTFDVVHVTPAGETVIAGRADPGTMVTILDGTKILGTVIANNEGQWVFTPEASLPSGAHQLRLQIERQGEDSVFSDDDVVVFVPVPGKIIGGSQINKDGRALALRLSRAGEGSAAVLLSPRVGDDSNSVRIDALDYNALGRIRVFGRATPGASVKVMLDDAVLGETLADTNGTWQLHVDEIIDPGDYTLRAETTDAAGVAVAQADVPLTAAPLDQDESGPRVLIVEPGQNLWRIARYVYGSGPAYTYIYGANRDKIRNPDLIYPGQEFRLPDMRGKAADSRAP